MQPAEAGDEGRRARIALNEALFRTVNETVQGLNKGFANAVETMRAVCECGNERCAEQVDVPVRDYARVRQDPTLFIIVAGHEIPDVEDVVERGSGFVVVRKKAGVGAGIAAETAPRGE